MLPTSQPIRIIAVNRNRILRDGLSVLINNEADLALVGCSATPYEGVRLFAEMRPDLTLMDLDEPSEAGLAAIQQIRLLEPAAWVIALLTQDWDGSGAQAIEAGADTVLTKDLIGKRLLPLIRAGRPIGRERLVSVPAAPLF